VCPGSGDTGLSPCGKNSLVQVLESVHVEKGMYNTLVRGYSKNLQIATFAVLAVVNIRLANYLLVITWNRLVSCYFYSCMLVGECC